MSDHYKLQNGTIVYTDEKEQVIAFYSNSDNEKTPYLRVYFKDEN